MKIFMTAGGTEEAIDGVRRISNSSTGRTGAVLARHFLEKGAELMLLHSPGAECRDIECRKEVFSSFADLEGLLRRNLAGERWDVLVHLAAVGDYSISSIEIGGGIFSAPLPSKIPGGEAITLRLKPNPKLVDNVRKWSINPELLVIAFKLTDTVDPGARKDAVRRLMQRARPDLVVHNDLSEVSKQRYAADIHDRNGFAAHVAAREDLARELWKRTGKFRREAAS